MHKERAPLAIERNTFTLQCTRKTSSGIDKHKFSATCPLQRSNARAKPIAKASCAIAIYLCDFSIVCYSSKVFYFNSTLFLGPNVHNGIILFDVRELLWLTHMKTTDEGHNEHTSGWSEQYFLLGRDTLYDDDLYDCFGAHNNCLP